MAKRSITRRWVFNNLGVVVLALLVIDMAIIFTVQTYFYNSAKQYLISKLNAVTSVLTVHSQDSSANFSAEMRNMLETFNEKDKIELMAINSKGRVVLTSSGFTPDAVDVMPDYEQAMSADTEASYIGKLSSGEKILAVSAPISSMNSEFSSVRMVTSLTEIDNTIKSYTIAVMTICAVIIFIIIITGLYFAGSIVRPIRQISSIARKFAMGDFSVRIENNSNDEIGDLCTAINHMADELSNAEAMKNEFISSVSHELRTPLTAIKGWAETLMIDGGSPETMKKGIGVIVNETERLSQMVEELLDFSRMQNGHFTLQMANMDILAELGDAVLIYSDKARRESKEIIYNEPEMLPIVFGDKNRIRQVFINVIDNAVKYSSAGDTVTIKAFEENGKIIVSVADTGVGIKESDLAKVKTKFYKANHTRRGSGIGLAVADEIVTMHGGSMDIASEGEGLGTTVTITLPTVDSTKTQ